MEPMRRGGKDMSILIGDGPTPFVTGQAWVHTQKRMFVTIVRNLTRMEAGWTNIKDGRGFHLFMFLLNELLHILYLLRLLIFQFIRCSIYVQFQNLKLRERPHVAKHSRQAPNMLTAHYLLLDALRISRMGRDGLRLRCCPALLQGGLECEPAGKGLRASDRNYALRDWRCQM